MLFETWKLAHNMFELTASQKKIISKHMQLIDSVKKRWLNTDKFSMIWME